MANAKWEPGSSPMPLEARRAALATFARIVRERHPGVAVLSLSDEAPGPLIATSPAREVSQALRYAGGWRRARRSGTSASNRCRLDLLGHLLASAAVVPTRVALRRVLGLDIYTKVPRANTSSAPGPRSGPGVDSRERSARDLPSPWPPINVPRPATPTSCSDGSCSRPTPGPRRTNRREPGSTRQASNSGTQTESMSTPGGLLRVPNRPWWRSSRLTPPAGFEFESEGPCVSCGVRAASELSFHWPAIESVLRSRVLAVRFASLPNGSTAVMVEARDIWAIPRPPSEQIPSSVRVLDVAVVPVGEDRRLLSITVTDPATVAQIAAMINHLTVVQPHSGIGDRAELKISR